MIDVLGSKNRLKILKNLSRSDMYLSELMDKVGMDSKNAKHHLKKLEYANIIESRTEGRKRYYSLKKEIRLEIRPPPKGKFLLYEAEK